MQPTYLLLTATFADTRILFESLSRMPVLLLTWELLRRVLTALFFWRWLDAGIWWSPIELLELNRLSLPRFCPTLFMSSSSKSFPSRSMCGLKSVRFSPWFWLSMLINISLSWVDSCLTLFSFLLSRRVGLYSSFKEATILVKLILCSIRIPSTILSNSLLISSGCYYILTDWFETLFYWIRSNPSALLSAFKLSSTIWIEPVAFAGRAGC